MLYPLSYSSFHVCLQQNSITLTLPYNHFSSLRLDSFPGQTEKTPNYYLTLTRSLSLALTSSCMASSLLKESLSFSLTSISQHASTCSNVTTAGKLSKFAPSVCEPALVVALTAACVVISHHQENPVPSSLSTPQLLTSAFYFIPQKQSLSQ